MTSFDTIKAQTRDVERQIIERRAGKEIKEKDKAGAEASMHELWLSAEQTAKARGLLELVVRVSDHSIKSYIEPLVTEALDFVFDQGLKFHLYSVSRRNQVEYDFVITRDSQTESDFVKYAADQEKYSTRLEQLVKETRNINFMYGGAVNQVLSLVLRFVLVELLNVRGPLLLDEPSSAVGEQYTARLGQLISSLSARFKRQIMLVTHSRTLASFAEISYNVERVNGISRVGTSDG